MVLVENKSDYRAMVSVANSSIPSFDAAPVLVVPGGEERWTRSSAEMVAVMTRHGWLAVRLPPGGYVRVGTRNVLVVPNPEDAATRAYMWFDNTDIQFQNEGFPFSVADVREICLMEHLSAKRAAAAVAAASQPKAAEFDGAAANAPQYGRGYITSES